MKPKFKSSREAFVHAILSGMAAPVFLFSPEFPKLHLDSPPANRMSDRDSLRADWCRIGADFNRIIERETSAVEQN